MIKNYIIELPRWWYQNFMSNTSRYITVKVHEFNLLIKVDRSYWHPKKLKSSYVKKFVYKDIDNLRIKCKCQIFRLRYHSDNNITCKHNWKYINKRSWHYIYIYIYKVHDVTVLHHEKESIVDFELVKKRKHTAYMFVCKYMNRNNSLLSF